MKLPIAIQLYSVRDAAEKDLEAVLKAIKEYGYEGVELAGFYGRTPAEMAELLKKYGLTAVSAHVGYADMCSDMAKVISDHKTVGCEYIAVPWLNDEDRLESENCARTVTNIRVFAKMCSDACMKLCYHNHDFEFTKINGVYAFDMLYSELPELFVEQDSCWVSVSGESPVEYLKKYSGRTPLLHLKDYVGSRQDGDFELRPNGYGVQDFKSIINAAEKCGVKWLIVEQDEPSMDRSSLECAKLSIDYLKEVVK